MYLDLLKALYCEENKAKELEKKAQENYLKKQDENSLNYMHQRIEYCNGLQKGIMIVEQQQKQIYYWKMYDYIMKNATDEEIKEHYKWYKVNNTTDLLNTMFESYCDNYDIFELEQRVKDLESESD